MNPELFSKAMSEVDDKYYEEAANYHCPKNRWLKPASLVACAAIVLAASFAALSQQHPGQSELQPDYNSPIITNPDDQWDDTKQVISLNINEIAAFDTVKSNMIELLDDDYTAMSYDELLTYFDVSLPIAETLSYLTLQSTDFGIFQSENRDIYYDGNSVVFQNPDGTQSINVGLSKVFKHTYDMFALSEEKLKFTNINGRELAVFHYTDENETECYYTEFSQDDVAFILSSKNISSEDYAKCLQALVKKTQQSSISVHTVTGEIIAIDPYANHIGIRLDEDQAPKYSRVYGIDLPDGQSADRYSLGDHVEVTYVGEPATILTIWAEQFVDISIEPHF